MEKEDILNKKNKSLANKIILASALVIGGSMAINHGSKINQIKEITSTYQGYTVEDGIGYLIFDDKQREARNDNPDLTIKGNPDTLKIGKEYTVKYSVKNWNHIFPNQIMKIKYAKHSN